jgi:threonine/homoserine/homoserine lactone efflux protein
VKFAGAIYLVFLLIRALFEKTSDLHLATSRLADAPQAFRQGVLAEVLNPKTALFFLAFLPQFVHPEHGFVVGQFASLGLVFVGMSAAYTSLIALMAGQVRRWLTRHKRVGRWQGRVVGAIYIALGVRLALQER